MSYENSGQTIEAFKALPLEDRKKHSKHATSNDHLPFLIDCIDNINYYKNAGLIKPTCWKFYTASNNTDIDKFFKSVVDKFNVNNNISYKIYDKNNLIISYTNKDTLFDLYTKYKSEDFYCYFNIILENKTNTDDNNNNIHKIESNIDEKKEEIFSLETIENNLKTISDLHVGQKMITSNESVGIEYSLNLPLLRNAVNPLVSIKRWALGSSRHGSLKIIKETVDNTLYYCDLLSAHPLHGLTTQNTLNDKNMENNYRYHAANVEIFKFTKKINISHSDLLKRLLDLLKFSVKGLLELKKTYETDINFCSEINELIQYINTNIKKYE